MALMGIDAVVFGVADMAEAKRFLDDWGADAGFARLPTSSSTARATAPR